MDLRLIKYGHGDPNSGEVPALNSVPGPQSEGGKQSLSAEGNAHILK